MLESTNCCGVDEIDGLMSTPEESLRDVCSEKYDVTDVWDDTTTKQAYILITDTIKSGRGHELVRYIRQNKLGDVVGARSRTNPNSGNKIKAWLWSPHEKNLKQWYKLINSKSKSKQ